MRGAFTLLHTPLADDRGKNDTRGIVAMPTKSSTTSIRRGKAGLLALGAVLVGTLAGCAGEPHFYRDGSTVLGWNRVIDAGPNSSPLAFNHRCEDPSYRVSTTQQALPGTDEFDCQRYGDGMRVFRPWTQFAFNGRCDDPTYNATTGHAVPGSDEYDCQRYGGGQRRPLLGVQ